MATSETVGISGSGCYFPKNKVSVDSLLKKAGVATQEKGSIDPGVSHIYIADPNEDSLLMSAKAAKAALEDAKLRAEDIGLLIYCDGVSRSRYARSCSHEMIRHLNLNRAYGFDMEGGFIVSLMAIQIAKDLLINSTNLKNALVVSAQKFEESCYYKGEKSRLANGIFGDGAAAVVLSKGTTRNHILATSFVIDHYTDLSDEIINKQIDSIKSGSSLKQGLNLPIGIKMPLPNKMILDHMLSNLALRASDNGRKAIEISLYSVNLGVGDVDLVIKSHIVPKETEILMKKLDLTKSSIYNASSEKGNLGHADTLCNIHLALKNAEMVDLDIILVVSTNYDCSAGALVLRR